MVKIVWQLLTKHTAVVSLDDDTVHVYVCICHFSVLFVLKDCRHRTDSRQY